MLVKRSYSPDHLNPAQSIFSKGRGPIWYATHGDTSRIPRTGRCYDLNGTDQSITIGDLSSDTDEFIADVYPDTTAGTTQVIIQLTATAYIRINAGNLEAVGVTSPTYYVDGVNTSVIAASKWQRVRITYTAIDTDNCVIGNNSTNYFDGRLHDVQLHLSSTLVRGYPLEEVWGVAALDNSGNGDHGVINNHTASIHLSAPLVPSSFMNTYGYSDWVTNDGTGRAVLAYDAAVNGDWFVNDWVLAFEVGGATDATYILSRNGDTDCAIAWVSNKLTIGTSSGFVTTDTNVGFSGRWMITHDTGQTGFARIKIYLDDVEQTTTTSGTWTNFPSSTSDIYLLSKSDATSEYDGQIRDIRFWTELKTVSEANSLLDDFDTHGIQFRLRVDTPSGVWEDKALHGNDFTITGGLYGTRVPADLSSPNDDVFGHDLQYKGQVAGSVKITNSNSGKWNAVDSSADFESAINISTGDFAFSFFFKPADLPAQSVLFCDKDNAVDRLAIALSDGSIRSRIQTTNFEVPTEMFFDNVTSHITMNFDRDGNLDVYRDGVHMGGVDISDKDDRDLNFVPRIGGSDGLNNVPDGQMWGWHVFTKLLTQQEIRKLSNGEDLHDDPDCVICTHFSEGAGEIAINKADTTNNAILNNIVPSTYWSLKQQRAPYNSIYGFTQGHYYNGSTAFSKVFNHSGISEIREFECNIMVPSQADTNIKYLASRTSASNNTNSIGIEDSSGLRVSYYDVAGTQVLTSVIQPNTAYKVKVTFSGTSCELFIDDVSVDTGTASTSNPFDNSEPILVGGGNANHYLNGSVFRWTCKDSSGAVVATSEDFHKTSVSDVRFPTDLWGLGLTNPPVLKGILASESSLTQYNNPRLVQSDKSNLYWFNANGSTKAKYRTGMVPNPNWNDKTVKDLSIDGQIKSLVAIETASAASLTNIRAKTRQSRSFSRGHSMRTVAASSQYADCSVVGEYTKDWDDTFSAFAWVRFTTTGAYCILGNSATTTDKGYIMLLSTTELEIQLRSNSNAANRIVKLTSGASLTNNTWYLLGFTYDGSGDASGLNLYINGVKQTGLTTSLDALTKSANSMIGTQEFTVASVPAGGSYMNGNTAETYIFNAELNEYQVAKLYSNKKIMDASVFASLERWSRYGDDANDFTGSAIIEQQGGTSLDLINTPTREILAP